MDLNSTSTNKFKIGISYALAIFTFIAFVVFVVLRQTSQLRFSGYEDYSDLIFGGFLNTILLSLIALTGSMILGFLFYLMQKSNLKYFNAMDDIFTEIIYGTPLLVLIIIMAFLIGPSFNISNFNYMGILAIIIYMAPYMKNVFKSGFSSISDEQYMAMDLFGFTSFQRYFYILIPQVTRIIMPPLMNNFSLIIKGSALLYVISFPELFQNILSAQSRNYLYVEGYLLLWLLYLIITIPLSRLTKLIERKWSL
ncbi:MAG TPA: ABC transporter permease subunit [Candidatus Izemoplasmatales bacterium]|nr:ABC transporter permease subunit [Candidatus Izemoplasmatales bacterium]